MDTAARWILDFGNDDYTLHSLKRRGNRHDGNDADDEYPRHCRKPDRDAQQYSQRDRIAPAGNRPSGKNRLPPCKPWWTHPDEHERNCSANRKYRYWLDRCGFAGW